MRLVVFIAVSFLFTGCNLVKWNQNRLNKKYERKNIHERFYEKDGHKLHYFEGGEGATVLLIHGFGGDAQITWNKTILDLTQDYNVIAPDLLWFGQSSSSAKAELKSQVDAILGLLDDRNVKECSVAGISYGGFVTLGLVYRKKEMFKKVCLVDSPGITYDISLLDTLAKEQGEETFQDIFVVKNAQDVKELYDLGLYKSKKVSKGLLEDAYNLYFSLHHEELTELLSTLITEQETFLNADIGTFPKTLVIWGAEDRVFPPSEGKKLAKYLGAEYKEIEEAGHAANLDNFEDFEEALRAFLKDE